MGLRSVPRRVTVVIDLGADNDDQDAVPEEGELLYRSLAGYAQVVGTIESIEVDYREDAS